jgi:hypothetical protein
MSKPGAWRHLCVRCDRALFVDLVKKHPLASLNELQDLVEAELGWRPAVATVRSFLTRCRIKRLSARQRLALQTKRSMAVAKAVAARQIGEPLLRPEHRALAPMASIFSLSQAGDQ